MLSRNNRVKRRGTVSIEPWQAEQMLFASVLPFNTLFFSIAKVTGIKEVKSMIKVNKYNLFRNKTNLRIS